MVTLRDIAERLGCTRSTVSYALRNHPSIAVSTRKRVQRIARELGWRPNAKLAEHMALVRGTVQPPSAGVALIINKPAAALQVEHTPRLHLEGARERAVELGYQANVFNLAEVPLSAARLRGILTARGIHVVVYVATLGTMLPRPHLAIGRYFSTAVVGVRFPDPAFNVAINDFASTGHTAICALQAAGFRRPAAVLPRGLEAMLAWGFTGGVHTGQLELAEENRVPTLLVGSREIYVPERSYGDILTWCGVHAPDAIFTTDPLHLAECLATLPKARRPRLFSLDLHPGQPVQGGIDQRQRVIGAAGVDLAVAALHRGEAGIPLFQKVLQVEGRWVGSVGAPTGSKPSAGASEKAQSV